MAEETSQLPPAQDAQGAAAAAASSGAQQQDEQQPPQLETQQASARQAAEDTSTANAAAADTATAAAATPGDAASAVAASDAAAAAPVGDSGSAEAAPGDVEASGEAADGADADADGGGDALCAEEMERRQEEARAAALATQPFEEQMAAVLADLKLKSQAAPAVRYLLRLLDARPRDVAAAPHLVALLSRVIADGPALPAAGGAMAALARLCLKPEGRARVRAEASLVPVVRFLAVAEPERAANAEAAAQLLTNAAADKLARRALAEAGAVEALVALLPRVKSHTSGLAAGVPGALMAVAAADGAPSGLQRFVDCGGIEAACMALAERPRSDAGRSTLRLRALLAEVCRASKAWEARAYQAAAEAPPNLLLAAAGVGSPRTPGAAAAAAAASAASPRPAAAAGVAVTG